MDLLQQCGIAPEQFAAYAVNKWGADWSHTAASLVAAEEELFTAGQTADGMTAYKNFREFVVEREELPL